MGVLPMVVLATCASVIASQAVITGLLHDATGDPAGLHPALEILPPRSAHRQIYMPFVNGSSSCRSCCSCWLRHIDRPRQRLRHAVSATMVTEVTLLMVVARYIWKWSWPMIAFVIGAFLLVDSIFLASNAAKFLAGGWFPLLIGAVIFALLMTWKRGRTLMFRKLSEQGIPLKPFLEGLVAHAPLKVQGTAIFLTAQTDSVPHALLHNLKHNKVLHERTVFLTIVTHDVPSSLRGRVQYERIVEVLQDRGLVRVQGAPTSTDPELVRVTLRPRVRRDGHVVLLSRDTVIPTSDHPGWRSGETKCSPG